MDIIPPELWDKLLAAPLLLAFILDKLSDYRIKNKALDIIDKKLNNDGKG